MYPLVSSELAQSFYFFMRTHTTTDTAKTEFVCENQVGDGAVLTRIWKRHNNRHSHTISFAAYSTEGQFMRVAVRKDPGSVSVAAHCSSTGTLLN